MKTDELKYEKMIFAEVYRVLEKYYDDLDWERIIYELPALCDKFNGEPFYLDMLNAVLTYLDRISVKRNDIINAQQSLYR